jgi:GAF domain-containing protein
MQPASLPLYEAKRLTTLYQYDILETPPEAIFDSITRLAARVCETPIALISLVDAHRQWFKAKVGVSAPELPREHAFCAHAILGTELCIVPDALQEERFWDNLLVTGAPAIRFYAGAPLRTVEGQALGTLCVIDCIPRQLTPDQQALLGDLSPLVVMHLEVRRNFVGLMGGRLWLESEEGRGSTFHFTVQLGVQSTPPTQQS